MSSTATSWTSQLLQYDQPSANCQLRNRQCLIKGGTVYGKSDETGDHPVKNSISVHDYQATILHQLKLDSEKLTCRRAGREFHLTDVHGRVLQEILG